MSHLPTERLAALADEAPTPAEAAHLASCAVCANERTAFRALAELSAGEGARIGAPLTSWERLAPALAADGVIDRGTGSRLGRTRLPWGRAAAAVLLAAGGIGAGRVSAGANLLPARLQHAATAALHPSRGTTDVAANNVNNANNASSASSANAVSTTADSAPHFGSIDDARLAQVRYQNGYQAATAYLAQADTAGRATITPEAIRTRLAALDRVRATMSSALRQAPYDPVINGYYLTTMGQREASMRQLDTMLPVGMRITSY